MQGATGVVFRDLEVENTGLYGVYPVECKDVLVERVVVTGARDAAIYVGQSRDIVVRKNEVHDNVTGIEIENSVNALVEDNYAHDNTGGILVFLLPNNPSKVGSDTRRRAKPRDREQPPELRRPERDREPGAAGNGHLHHGGRPDRGDGQRVRGNDSFGVAVVSLASAFPRGTSFDVGIVPEGNRIFGNTLADNGRNPAGSIKAVAGRGVRSALGRERLGQRLEPARGHAIPLPAPGSLLARRLAAGLVAHRLVHGREGRLAAERPPRSRSDGREWRTGAFALASTKIHP